MNAFDEPLRFGFHPRSFLNEKSLFFVNLNKNRPDTWLPKSRAGGKEQ